MKIIKYSDSKNLARYAKLMNEKKHFCDKRFSQDNQVFSRENKLSNKCITYLCIKDKLALI
jgi:hypothetical protein